MSQIYRPDVPSMYAVDEAEMTRLQAHLRADEWPEDLLEGRPFYDAWGTPVADDIEVSEREVAGVPAYLFTPPDADRTRIGLWLHGGGYVFGSRRSHEGLVGEVARNAGFPFLLPLYRLAPEHRYPAAADDAIGAYTTLLEEGWDPDAIVIGGDSAGGGLTFATLLAARDRGLPKPRAAVGVSPWIDLAYTGETFQTKEKVDRLISRSVVAEVAKAYLAGTPPETPYASPLYGAVQDFPPVLIQVGEREMLLSDSERFAAKLADSGSPVTLEIWPGMIHVWHMHYTRLAKAHEALARLGAFLRTPVVEGIS